MSLMTFRPEELDDPEPLRKNWFTMLGFLAANPPARNESMTSAILVACRNGATRGELERCFDRIDPMHVRATVFRLILDCSVQCLPCRELRQVRRPSRHEVCHIRLIAFRPRLNPAAIE